MPTEFTRPAACAASEIAIRNVAFRIVQP
jgi:hypothetical protein